MRSFEPVEGWVRAEAKELIENAYGVFEGQAINLVLYIAGQLGSN